MMFKFMLNLSFTIFANQPSCIPWKFASEANTSTVISFSHEVGNSSTTPSGVLPPVVHEASGVAASTRATAMAALDFSFIADSFRWGF